MKIRRRIAVFLILFELTAGFFPAGTAFADDNENTVLHISDAEGLIRLSKDCRLNTYSERLTVVLDRDIDLGEVPFEPVPTFSGKLDGQNHRISGFVLAEDGSHQGLIRYLQGSGEVTHLTVEGTVAPDNSRCQVGGIAGVNYGSISDCHFSGTVSGLNYIGGIAGVNYGSIDSCSAEGSISGKRFTGGICGWSEGTVSGCRNDATVNGTVTDGGLELDNLNLTNFSEALSLVTAEDTSVVSDTGGITGYSDGVINDCRNEGSVGYPHYGYNAGGIAGRQSGYIFGCVNNGSVFGRKDIAGICGQMEPWLFLKNRRNIADEIKTLNHLISIALNTVSDETGSVARSLYALRDYTDAFAGELSGLRNNWTDMTDRIREDPASFDPEELLTSLSELSDRLSAEQLGSDAEQLSDLLFCIKTAIEDASDLTVEKLRDVNDQGSVVLDMFSSALAGNTTITAYDDVSEGIGDGSTEGRVEQCRNNGTVSGDINVGGISGAMAIEYEFDMEGTILNAVTDAASSGSITSSTFKSRCVCISDKNYGTVTGKKDNIGGINGLQDAGYIVQCENYGNVTSNEGGYVGGISGRSCSVSGCCSLCSVFGNEYVGGISGFAEKIMNCASIVTMENVTACRGAVAGYLNAPDEEHLSGNTFISDTLGAVDGISYQSLAEPVDYPSYAGREDLPELFKQLKLVFIADDTVVAELPFTYGASFSEKDFPEVPRKEGYTGKWAEADLSDLTGSHVIRAEYSARLSTVESMRKREGTSLPLIVAEGDFTDRTEVLLTPYEYMGGLPDVPESVLLEAWSLDITDSGKDPVVIRYNTPALKRPAVDHMELYVLNGSGWEKTDYSTLGSYSAFETGELPVVFCAVEAEKRSTVPLLACIGAGAAVLTAVTVIVTVRKRKKQFVK